jgi:NAD(P)-dependent dehydrogenase (short-subunit alcohol dehydrogenase family)
VVGVDISQERLDEVAVDVPTGHFLTVAGDVRETTVIDEVVALAGDVDGLANVAGVMDGFLPLAEVDDDTWHRVMSINLDAVMRLSRAVLPGMLERGRGSIVNVTSEAGLRASAAGTAYTASKHAVIGLTRSAAFFYTPRGVRVNAVAPGATLTNIEAPFLSKSAAERIGPFLQVSVPPPAEAHQVASAITWLLSDDASNVSGAVLSVDGGWAAV